MLYGECTYNISYQIYRSEIHNIELYDNPPKIRIIQKNGMKFDNLLHAKVDYQCIHNWMKNN